MLVIAGLVLLWQPKEVVVKGTTMGTTYHVVAYKRGLFSKSAVNTAVEKRLTDISNVFSTYDNQSEITKINRYRGDGGISISGEFAQMFALGDWLNAITKGAWDGTLFPLIELWGFGPDGRSSAIPKQDEFDVVKARTGWQFWTLPSRTDGVFSKSHSLKKEVVDSQLDFNSIAKGYGVDAIADVLVDRGFSSFFIEIGGEVRVGGLKPNLNSWRVGLQVPKSDGETSDYFRVLAVSDVAVATSGSYRNFWTDKASGRRFSHIIDPRTGWPTTTHVISATVIHKNCAKADGLATALMVMSPESGLKMIEEQAGTEALLVIQDSENAIPYVRQTTGFSAYDVTASLPGFRTLPF